MLFQRRLTHDLRTYHDDGKPFWLALSGARHAAVDSIRLRSALHHTFWLPVMYSDPRLLWRTRLSHLYCAFLYGIRGEALFFYRSQLSNHAQHIWARIQFQYGNEQGLHVVSCLNGLSPCCCRLMSCYLGCTVGVIQLSNLSWLSCLGSLTMLWLLPPFSLICVLMFYW